MAVNLVSLISQFLTPDIIAKLGRALGVDTSVLGRAIGAAVPGLLGSLAGATTTQDGSRKLFDAVKLQQPGVLDELTDTLGGSGKVALIESGSKVLSSVLGGAAVPALAGAVAKYAGMGQNAGTSLLGVLAPVVMGALGQETAASGLDSSGLKQLMASQKGNISAALPSGFADMLGAAGVPGFQASGAAGAQAARTVQAGAARANSVAKSGVPSWLYWVVPLIAILALGWWFLGRGTEVVDQGKNAADQTVKLSVGDVDVGSTLQTILGGLKTTLGGITDTASAQSALPKLQDASAQLDKLGSLAAQLPAAGKTALAALVASARPSVEELFNKVLALPGVEAVAKPVVDKLRTTLDGLAKA